MPIRASSASLLSPTPITPSNSRCQGLDLLVLAVLQLGGNGALALEGVTETGRIGTKEVEEEDSSRKDEGAEEGIGDDVGLKPKRKRRHLAMPVKYQDSVLQPWKRRTRRRILKGDA